MLAQRHYSSRPGSLTAGYYVYSLPKNEIVISDIYRIKYFKS